MFGSRYEFIEADNDNEATCGTHVAQSEKEGTVITTKNKNFIPVFTTVVLVAAGSLLLPYAVHQQQQEQNKNRSAKDDWQLQYIFRTKELTACEQRVFELKSEKHAALHGATKNE